MNRMGLMTSMAMVGTGAAVALWAIFPSGDALKAGAAGTQASIWAPAGVPHLQQTQIDGLPIAPSYDHGFVFASQP